MNARVDVTDEEFMLALRRISEAMQKRIEKKGRGSLISLHEIDGAVDEAIRRFKREVEVEDRMAALNELEDLGLQALLGIASICAHIRVESDAAKAAAKPPAKPGSPGR